MIGKVFVAILAVFLLLGAFRSPITEGINGWRSDDSTQNFNVTTAAAQTTANLTLSYDLYQAALAEVDSITSTEGTDAPVAATYTEATKVLLVSGLDDDNTRTLTVVYKAETDDTVMQILGPFLAFLIFGGLLFAIVWGIFKPSRR